MAESPESPSPSSDPLADVLASCGAEDLPPTQDGIRTVRVEADSWQSLARRLRDQEQLSYELLVSLTAVDWLEADPRYEVVSHLWSLRHNTMLRVKVPVSEHRPRCPSVVPVWPTADWLEREAYDMFGIEFEGHPDLRRILMPDEYQHYPLRKDFPVEGIDNAACYLQEGGVLMTDRLDVDQPAGQDPTPVDRSHGDPEGYTDGAEELN